MNQANSPGGDESSKVRHLYTDRDVARLSRNREELPAYRDPIFQLIGASAAFVGAFAASLVSSGNLETLFQALVIVSGFLGGVVLLRSVRHGWNVNIYGRAREASWREATLRMERDALREVPERCARVFSKEGHGNAIEILQALTETTQRTLDRTGPTTSVAVVEELQGRYLVICMAGYIERGPFYVSPGKSCAADRPFTRLLETFAPDGRIVVDEVVSNERRFWVGLASKERDAKLDPGASKAIASWLHLVEARGMLPQSQDQLLRAG